MSETFDPQQLTPAASLNRLQIADLPGIRLDVDVKGRTGYDLLSARYLAEQVRAHTEALQLPSGALSADERELPRWLDHCARSNETTVQRTARTIARQYGRHLGYVLLTLRRGDAVNRAARPDWDDSWWAHWSGIRTVYVGGGLASGNLSEDLLKGAQAVFEEAREPEAMRIERSQHEGSLLPLIGAARHVPGDSESGIVLDFGSSFVKRACAIYESGYLSKLLRLPSVSSQWTGEGEPQRLFDFIVEQIAETWAFTRSAGLSPAATVPISLASYVDAGGQPYERQGGAYTGLRRISSHVQSAFSSAVSERLNRPTAIRLLHDGSAAATTYAGQQQTAVLMLGTAIGVGFPPSETGLCPIASDLTITDPV